MKKRILSFTLCGMILFGISTVSVINAKASSDELKKVDGSYLTMEESSLGKSTNMLTKGKHMMTGRGVLFQRQEPREYILLELQLPIMM